MYEWLKVLHIISFVSWFAGLFYLPRLFVYHSENSSHEHTCKTLEVMEYKLLKYIMNPAMIATWIFGVTLIHYVGFSGGWLHTKILLVVILSGYHMYLGVIRKKLIIDSSKYSSKYFRYINEVPTVLLILIVILAIIKPF
jgi:putative membrane protein|tara:strand:+ start:255 stop:674 length:420 start_codon:yes stop_codon:yes gene_type:complete